MNAARDLSLLWHLFVASQRVSALLEAAMADAPLRPDEYAVYSLLADEGMQTPTEMARRLGFPPTTMSHYVRAMVQRGHAERLPGLSDGRSYRLALNSRGRATHREAGRAFEEANRRFRASLGADEAFLRRSLEDIGRAAEEAIEGLASARQAAAG